MKAELTFTEEECNFDLLKKVNDFGKDKRISLKEEGGNLSVSIFGSKGFVLYTLQDFLNTNEIFLTVDLEQKLVQRTYILVRKDLKMTKGKVLSQVGHALFAFFERNKTNTSKDFLSWKKQGQTKIVLKVSEEELNKTISFLNKEDVKYDLIVDAGKTQIEPASRTCLILGPISEKNTKVNMYLSTFKLY